MRDGVADSSSRTGRPACDHDAPGGRAALLLAVGEHELGVQRQVGDQRVDRELREEVALGDVDATEPVRPDAGDTSTCRMRCA